MVPPFRIRRIVRAALLAAMLLACAPCALARQSAAQPAAAQSVANNRIAPGAVLSVTVEGETQLSGAYTVGTDGAIQLILTDDNGGHKQEWTVPVGGKTPAEAAATITASLTKYLVAPKVHVAITRSPMLRVEIVSRATQRSGMLDLPLGAHLSDAMAAAAYTSRADLAHVLILRVTAGAGEPAQLTASPQPSGVRNVARVSAPDGAAHPRPPTASQAAPTTTGATATAAADEQGTVTAHRSTLIVDFAAFQNGQSDTDPALQTGDRIVIDSLPQAAPQPALKLARVLGEVNQEASVPVAPGMTVRDVLERVGGIKETADREQIRLVRGADGKDYVLDYDKLTSGDPVYNLSVGGGDLIIVGRRDQSLRYAVMGEVLQQKAFELKRGEKVTLLKAIEQVGGVTKQADPRHGVISKGYLTDPTHVGRTIPFDLQQVEAGRQPNWQIEAGDVVMVPKRVRKPNWLQQLLPLALHFLPFGL